MLKERQSRLGPPAPLDMGRTALFLDLDGTLARIEASPDAVGPDPRRSDVLQRLSAGLEGRIAIVSGRAITVIDEILEGQVICAAGVHGLERRGPDGRIVRPEPHAGLHLARAALGGLVAEHDGLLLEDKGLSLALHYRSVPTTAGPVISRAREAAVEAGLALQLGDHVVELKTPGADKGTAVKAFMREAPFVGGLPVFVGDDLTDEDAFTAVAALGGFGVLVGPPRPTAATYRLGDVDAVLQWLESSLEMTRAHD